MLHALAFVVLAATPTAELTSLVEEFLAGASRNDAAVHDRFWADDLIYTGSSGRRVGKADILKDVKDSPPPKPEDPQVTYTAEDIRVHPYKDTAVVAFRLVGTTVAGGKTSVQKYLNTGTFVKRKGQWRAVAWQATKLPRPDADAMVEVVEAESTVRTAMRDGNFGLLATLLDNDFVWIQRNGEPKTKRQFFRALTEHPRDETDEASDVTVSVYGDAAVVRGKASGEFFVITFVNRGEGWKAVAMQ